jgi:4-hydroxy-2-oxoheptanedioate aldolase
MIETREALDNLDAILDVPGIDGIYVGPGDLSFSLGLLPKLDRDEPQVLQIYERLICETNQRDLHAGIHCASPVYAARMIRSGFRLVTIANDSGLLAKAASESVAGVWAEAGDFR